jgi:hypothetical protein
LDSSLPKMATRHSKSIMITHHMDTSSTNSISPTSDTSLSHVSDQTQG